MTDVLKILVVDDNVDAAETLGLLLGIDGHDAQIVHNGEDALKAIRNFGPDIAFVDIGLPDINGYELAQQARALDLPRQPVLVALTGWGGDEDRRKSHASGFNAHLVKPVDLEKINETLLLVEKQRS